MRFILYGYIFLFCLMLSGISEIYGKKYKNPDLEDGSGESYKVKMDKNTKQFKKDDDNQKGKIYEENKCKGKYCKQTDEGNDDEHERVDQNKEERISKYAKKKSENNHGEHKKYIRSRQVKENDSDEDIRVQKQDFSKKLERNRNFDDKKLKSKFQDNQNYGDELNKWPRKIRRLENGDEDDLEIKSEKTDFSKSDKYAEIKKESAREVNKYKSKSKYAKNKTPLKINENDEESDELVDTDSSGNRAVSRILENKNDEESDDGSDDGSDDASDDTDENNSKSSETTCDKQSTGKDSKCEDDNEEDDIWADTTEGKKKIKYSIKFAHEKHKSSHTQDENVMRKIHGTNKKKYKYNDGSEEDYAEDHVHPKRVRFVDDDDYY